MDRFVSDLQLLSHCVTFGSGQSVQMQENLAWQRVTTKEWPGF